MRTKHHKAAVVTRSNTDRECSFISLKPFIRLKGGGSRTKTIRRAVTLTLKPAYQIEKLQLIQNHAARIVPMDDFP